MNLRERDERMMNAMSAVFDERRRQDEKWGQQDHAYSVWLAILAEEQGEAAQEFLRINFGNRDRGAQFREELVQATAVMLAMIECGDRNGWFE